MKIKFFSILIIVSFYILPLFSKAHSNASTVVAYVNNTIITLSDLEQFAKFKSLTDGSAVPSTFPKKKLLTLREELIQQTIQLQEVKAFCKDMLKKKYFISAKEVTDFISSIAVQYNKTYDGYIASLLKHGISSEIAKNFWETRLAWSKYLQYMYGAMINISDKDAENIISSQEAQIEGTKYKLAKIVVPIDKKNPEKAIAIISSIYNQLLRGKKFSSFIQNKTTGEHKPGISLGWVSTQSLDKNTLAVVQTLQKGDYSNYFQENNNFVIYLLEDKVVGKIVDKIIKTRIVLTKDLEQFELEELSYLVKNSTSIKNFLDSLKKNNLATKVKVLDQQIFNLSELDPDFAAFLQQFKSGEITPFVNSQQGLMLFCIDERKDVVRNINKEQIKELLFEQKLSEYSQKRIKDLLRTAHIDRIDF